MGCNSGANSLKTNLSCSNAELDKISPMPTTFYKVKEGDTAQKIIRRYTILPPEGWGMIFVSPDLKPKETIEIPVPYLKDGIAFKVHRQPDINQKTEEELTFFILSGYISSLTERKSIWEKVKTKIFRSEIFKENYDIIPEYAFYGVRKGDTAWELTKKYTVFPPNKWGEIFPSSNIKVGQIIKFPIRHLKAGTVVEIWREPNIIWETVEKNDRLSLKRSVILGTYFILL